MQHPLASLPAALALASPPGQSALMVSSALTCVPCVRGAGSSVLLLHLACPCRELRTRAPFLLSCCFGTMLSLSAMALLQALHDESESSVSSSWAPATLGAATTRAS